MGDDIRTAALTLWNEHVAEIAERANIAKSRAIYLALRDPIGRRLWALAKSPRPTWSAPARNRVHRASLAASVARDGSVMLQDLP
jgi:hypothetical protein